MSPSPPESGSDPKLTARVRELAHQFGFSRIGIAGTEVEAAWQRYRAWLEEGMHGEMAFLERHQDLRRHPEQLHPGTLKVICVTLDYLPPGVEILRVLRDPKQAYISRYALGRDYHKTLRKRLLAFARAIEAEFTTFNYRPFVDSAPVLEKPLAQEAGIGWQGKHSLLIDRERGSYFVLGELFTDLPLVNDEPCRENHCRTCTACMDVCPTGAIVRPYVLDARRCISYLTIELKGPIPVELRPLIGNRIFGCDDCQLVCPWNHHARPTPEVDFLPRHGLDRATLVELFRWDEATFLKRTEGSALRRPGYEGWLRNLAVALGNSGGGEEVMAALGERMSHPSELVREHCAWALERLQRGEKPAPLPIDQGRHARKVRYLS